MIGGLLGYGMILGWSEFEVGVGRGRPKDEFVLGGGS